MEVARCLVSRVLSGVVVSVLISTVAGAQTSAPNVPIGPGAATVAIVPVTGSQTGGSETSIGSPRGFVWWPAVSLVPPLHAALLPVFRPYVATLRESHGWGPLGRRDAAGRLVPR